MHTATRCILLAIGVFSGVLGRAQQGRTDTFVLHFAFDHSEIRPVDTASLHLFVYGQLHPAEATATTASTTAATNPTTPAGAIAAPANPDIDSIGITGYTDTVGTEAYNLRLSLRRALSAVTLFRQWLGPDSILPTRIDAQGEADPLPGDDSESRRVTIICWHHPPPPPPPVVARIDTPRDIREPDTVFELDDIRFYANTANLTDAAQLVLPRHINYLLTLKERYLEIDGYCNSPGPPLPTNDPLYILSVKRAKFIYERLIEKGFDPDKLVYKGKGNTNPRNPHPTTRDEMDKNMRVEIRVFRQKPEP
ncbi:MAG TPA: OmpA family protein [Puia sp.]|jgi:outer membrane protein OmpA-like peptidoglycan-associated protein|nr:OmpA family protein [Puia sp.]